MTCQGASAALATMTLPDLVARVTSLSIFAPMIQLNFQSSDLSPTSTPTPTEASGGDERLTLATGAPESTGLGFGGRPSPTNTGGPQGSGSGSGVSVGAIVGVGVAAGLGFLAVLVGGCWIWQRQLRRRRDVKDAALQKLDTLYEVSRPAAFESDGASRYQVKPLPARPLGVDDYAMHTSVAPGALAPAETAYRPYRPSDF